MATLPLPHHALVAGTADGLSGREWRTSRPAIIVSILAHLAVLYAASQFYEVGPAPIATTFEWLTAFEAPSEPVVQPSPEVVEPPVPAIGPVPSPRTATVRSVSPSVVVPPQREAPAEALPAPPPSRLDLESARREAAVAVVAQRTRDSTLLAPSVDNVPPPQVPRTAAPKKPSIFDHEARSGRSLMQPGKQRTVVGQRLSLWCNKVSGGGFGFFGIPVCASQGIQPPSGIFADSIPEYMKLKPECEETEPLAATLGESAPFPTMKCRLVPKEPGE
jgi:hypothetical protein